jgi:hypothetical protein
MELRLFHSLLLTLIICIVGVRSDETDTMSEPQTTATTHSVTLLTEVSSSSDSDSGTGATSDSTATTITQIVVSSSSDSESGTGATSDSTATTITQIVSTISTQSVTATTEGETSTTQSNSTGKSSTWNEIFHFSRCSVKSRSQDEGIFTDVVHNTSRLCRSFFAVSYFICDLDWYENSISSY